MFSRVFSLTALLLLLAAILTATESSHAAHIGHGSVARRHNLHNHLSTRDFSLVSSLQKRVGNTTTGPRKRRSCVAKASASLLSSSATAAATKTTTSTAKATGANAAASAAGTSGAGSGNKAPSGNGSGLKPANWPTETQAGAAPAATRTSPADPFLLALSKSYNNADNPLYTEIHTGQMTFYGQGLGACGDTYDDSSFTAAVSRLMYDTWPGAVAGEMNRNPICGPFVPGRKAINQAGIMETVVPGAQFVDIGGDGLLNCDLQSQCHIPLTATVTHGDKSIQVKIVDRCEACAIGDIDMTPTAFAALADMSLGRTSVQWHFNVY